MKRKKTEKMLLECILTDPEKLAYGKELTQKISEKCRHEASLKSYSTQAKAEITSCDGRIAGLAEKLNAGIEYREVECSVSYDFESRKKLFTRTDTGEIVKEVSIGDDELQEELDVNVSTEK
jgi:hypothetical protein